ncbi:MAG: LuxR family transcriptional regulator [Gemmatimonadetes bacterium HGW-Gemmatimonadetes-1]|nr:MAG: LuxR family transcriptional regulator [Gemmatimonadetes bacterium HGW-Gemmatimonadetes-1]
MLVDSHCHLTDPAYAADLEEVVARQHAAWVTRALVIESVPARLEETLRWAASHPGFNIATGCHPHDAAAWTPELAHQLVKAWADPLVAAAGEMGLDYHYDFAPRELQRDVFAEQLDLAVRAGKPVVIHAREADQDMVAILREQPGATVILHSFSSGTVLRDAGLAASWYFSFSGMVSFKSWTDVETLRSVPDNRLLLETDSPYLAPVPFRGKRNEPAHLATIAAKVAEWRGTTPDYIARVTTENALRLFWPLDPPHP